MSEDFNYCFISIETGGLNPKKNPITYLEAIVTNTSFEKLASLSTYVKGEGTIEPEALMVSNITPENIESGVSEKEMLILLNSLLLKFNNAMPIMFNVAFTLPYIRNLSLKHLFPLSTPGLYQDLQELNNLITGSKKFRYDSVLKEHGLEYSPDKKSKCETNIELAKKLMS